MHQIVKRLCASAIIARRLHSRVQWKKHVVAFVLTNKSPGMLRLLYSTVYGRKGTDLNLVSCQLSFAAGASA